jgi:shikimate 5-dehydrogenase
MSPHADATPAPAESLRPGALVFDTVYRPLETRLLREARARGCRVQDGLEMLVHQAVEQIRIWSGKRADAGALRRAALDALRSETP